MQLSAATLEALDAHEPMPNASKMEIGRYIAEAFYLAEEKDPTFTWNWVGLEAWVDAAGFQYFDWGTLNSTQHLEVVFVRAWEGGDETFILEYSGHDEMILSLFNKTNETVIG